MKVHLIDNHSETNIEWKPALERMDVEFSADEPDFVLCFGIDKQDIAHDYLKRRARVITYCWDFYQWAKDGKHSTHNWPKYEILLKRSTEVWVPSEAQQRRLAEWGIKSVVIPTSIKTYDHEATDERFVLDPVRYYEHDPQCYWVRDACEELGIPFVHSEHQFTLEEFRKKVSSCTLMTCGYIEASTGGLTLMEGLWNGKPSLVSDSPYMGARTYLGDFGYYFSDYEDLKVKLKELFFNPPQINVEQAREYITREFSPEQMAKTIKERLCELNQK